MRNQDVYDILKSLDDEQEQNSHEGFNRSKFIIIKNAYIYLFFPQIISKMNIVMKIKIKKRIIISMIYIKQREKKKQRMILMMTGKMIKMIFLIIIQDLMQIKKKMIQINILSQQI